MVEGAVVIAGEGTAIFAGQPLDVAQFTIGKVSDKDMKAAMESSGNEGHVVGVRREAWFDVDGSIASQLERPPVLDIQSPDLDRIPHVAVINDPAAVRGPIGLVIVPRICGELLRHL